MTALMVALRAAKAAASDSLKESKRQKADTYELRYVAIGDDPPTVVSFNSIEQVAAYLLNPDTPDASAFAVHRLSPAIDEVVKAVMKESKKRDKQQAKIEKLANKAASVFPTISVTP
jgi:hypothetical protein